MKTLATVIVPVYKVEDDLPSCIASIQAQTYKNLQILLVDDGSPDQCGQICDQYAAKDSRIQVIHQANGGVGSARNAGLAAAKGEYVFFVDSDDMAKENMVERAVGEMEAGGYDLCAWGAEVREKQDVWYKGRRRERTFHFKTEKEKARFFCRWFLTSRTGWEVYLRVFRRKLIEEHGLRFGREIFAEDMDFTFRYLIHCESFHLIAEPLYIYRVRQTSAMQTIDRQRQFDQIMSLLQRQREELSLPYGKFYVYGGAALSAFIGEPEKGESAQARLEKSRGFMKNCPAWEALVEDARLALVDRAALKKLCGFVFGPQVYALYGYLLDGDWAAYQRRAAVYAGYLKLRNLKKRLL